MLGCFWCHGEKNNNPDNPFCTNRCQVEHHRYELYLKKLKQSLTLGKFRIDPQKGIGTHTKIIDRIWKEMLA